MSDGGAAEYKDKGNAAFKAGDLEEAIKNYNKAIQLDPNQAAFYSNRAACWSSKGNHDSALADSKKCLETDPNFIKGYSRKGKALFDLSKLDEAEAAYKEGLEKEASNPGCLQGISDVQRARAASQARRSAGGGGGGGMFSGLMGGGIGKKVMDAVSRGGRGGRMQMYGVLAMGYFMFNSWNKGSRGSSSGTSGHDVADDLPSASSPGQVRRSFSDIDGTWVSYVETANRGDSLLLFLHRTSLSADGEYGAAISRVLEKAASPPPGGLRVVAPDRPCHGYSPCPSGKADGGWLEGLLSKRPKAKKLTIVASGRAAASQALALAHDRMQPSRLLLVSPGAGGLDRGGLADPTADSTELQKWLAGQQKTGLATASAAADAARWAVASNADNADEDDDKLVASGLPEGSEVTTLYMGDEKEDADLKEELEGLGLSVKVRRAQGSDAVLDALVSEAWRMAASEADADEDSNSEM